VYIPHILCYCILLFTAADDIHACIHFVLFAGPFDCVFVLHLSSLGHFVLKFLVFFVFVLLVVSLVVSASATDCLERLVSKVSYFIMCKISQLGRALAVVKVTLQVNGNSEFSPPPKKKKLLGQ